MTQPTRLRQVALVARELAPVSERLAKELDLGPPFADSGVAEFGLENAVYASGDTFIEIVAPTRPGTTAGRLLDKRGGDGGYMAIFQVPDMTVARERVAAAGFQVVWKADLPDISGTHLHPRDVPGAIVSLDWADPPESWHWAGPAWIGRADAGRGAGSIAGITVTGGDARTVAAKWAVALAERADATGTSSVIELDGGRQSLRFVSGTAEPSITGVSVYRPAGVQRDPVVVCGVTFSFVSEDDR